MKKKIFISFISAVLSVTVLCCCVQGRGASEPGDGYDIDVTETEAVPVETEETFETAEPTEETTAETEPVVDVAAPFFMNISRDVYVTVGNEFDVNNYISYIDDHDSDVDLEIEGSVDMATAGTYHLNLFITDDAGNSANDQITVYVSEPVEPGATQAYTGGYTTDDATSFETFMNSYQGSEVHYGIDVSHWQGNIDWNTVAASGCEFAIIRAGWSSAGEFHQDDYFVSNMEGATAAGIPVGVYVYTSDNEIEAVENLADLICDLTADYDVDLPIVFDWENFYDNFQKYGLSIDDLNALYRAFDARVEARGMTSMLYASKFVLEIIWDDYAENVWLAHYTSQTDYSGNYVMWQQSCTGSIPGIDAYVDMDLLYGELPGG